MTQTKGDASCATKLKSDKTVKNRVAASLADARFRPKRTQDRTKKHPRQRKHKVQNDE